MTYNDILDALGRRVFLSGSHRHKQNKEHILEVGVQLEQKRLNEQLVAASKKGDLVEAKRLCTSPSCKYKHLRADVSYNNKRALHLALEHGYKDVADYLDNRLREQDRSAAGTPVNAPDYVLAQVLQPVRS